jgi:glucosamine kinase
VKNQLSIHVKSNEGYRVKKIENQSNKNQFILGIDGGASKTLARLVNIQTGQYWHAQGGPSSLTNDFYGAISTITNLCQQVIHQAQKEEKLSINEDNNPNNSLCNYHNISAVFGLAGAENKERVQQLKEALAMPFVKLIICSDAKISAYGANNGEAVAIVALGTGSVGFRLDDNGDSYLVGGWGFTVGDEGSGAKLGLAAVQVTINELENKGTINSKLTQRISDVVGKERIAMLTWLSTAQPYDFAKFTPLVFSLASTCPVAKALLKQHLVAVEQLIQLTLAKTHLPLVLLGGLAKATQPYLATKYQQYLITAKGNALDGACFLAQQFLALKPPQKE